MSKGVNALANDINYAVHTPAQQALATANATTPTAFPSAGTDKYFRKAIIIAVKDLAGTVDTTDVKIGTSIAASSQPLVITKGTSYILEAPTGSKFRFDQWFFVTGTTGDGIVVIYS